MYNIRLDTFFGTLKEHLEALDRWKTFNILKIHVFNSSSCLYLFVILTQTIINGHHDAPLNEWDLFRIFWLSISISCVLDSWTVAVYNSKRKKKQKIYLSSWDNFVFNFHSFYHVFNKNVICFPWYLIIYVLSWP